MNNFKFGAQIAFLIVGALTVAEFVFVRGMFTWLIVSALTLVVGLTNVVLCLRDKEWLHSLHYALSVVALLMGYMVLA